MNGAPTLTELSRQLTRARQRANLALHRRDMAGCVLAESRIRAIVRQIAAVQR